MKKKLVKGIYNKKIIKGCVIFFCIYIACFFLFYVGEGEQLFIRDTVTPIISTEGDMATPEITSDYKVQYVFVPGIDVIDNFSLRFATFARTNTGVLNVTLKNVTDGTILFEETLDVSSLVDSEYVNFEIPHNKVYDVRYDQLMIEISSSEGKAGNAVAPWINSTANMESGQLYYNGVPVAGQLCFNCDGRDLVWTGVIFKQIIAVITLFVLLGIGIVIYRDSKGSPSVVVIACRAFKKYRFLMKQLVSRDFKTKYKKSFFGILWSFISPLLMMLIQYLVFSQIFQSSIENFPVYLLSGSIIFSFFSESVSLSIESIVGNASLITKVYVPKYIYPFTRVCSSTINLFISLVLLFVMAILTGIPFTKSFLLLPFPLIMLFVFSLGMGLLLSTSMVFFRDTQFLWGAVSMAWMYATPIFYPENILPENFQFILKINPVYYYLQMLRKIIMEGKGIEPKLFVLGGGIALLTFLVGSFVFKRNQDKFILNI